MEHVKAYAEKHNPEKKRTMLIFFEKTNSEICASGKKTF